MLEPSSPRVSICVPNLNTRPFLEERFATIFNQTFKQWEIFAYDSFSDDGAWEYLESLAAQEPRMRVAQGPRAGPYRAWNECIKGTNSEYVYIATSDDTMAPDCIEKLVEALDRHPECDLAHCPLKIIDETGGDVRVPQWPEVTVFAHGMEEMAKKAHIRHAPYDGLLHLTGRHVYLSITQLLIRRSLFAKVGLFPSDWGSISDFNWEMKASLVGSTVHVPSTWASWRIHAAQATVSGAFHSPERDLKIEAMILDAYEACRPFMSAKLSESLWWQKSRELRSYYSTLRHEPNVLRRRSRQLVNLIVGSASIRSEILSQFAATAKWPEPAPDQIRRWVESSGTGPAVSLIHRHKAAETSRTP